MRNKFYLVAISKTFPVYFSLSIINVKNIENTLFDLKNA